MKKIFVMLLFIAASELLCAQFNQQAPVVISEQIENAAYLYPQVAASDSGYYVTWYDENQNFKMYMQYVNPKGEPQWTSPLVVTDYTQDSWISDYSLKSDGDNAYVFFADARNGLTDKDIFGYKINSQGEFLWGEPGVELIVATGYDSEYSPDVALMPNGDVVAAWNKMDADGYSINMQWLNSDGERLWENGLKIAETDIRLFNPNLMPATDSTVFLVYTYQNGQYGDKQVLAQQIGTSGQNVWDTVLGVTGNSGIGEGRRLKLHSSSDSGIYITWYGDPDGNTLNDVFTQHVDLNGNMRYESGGLNLSVNNQMNQTTPSCLGQDWEGNALFAWHETPTSKESNFTKIQKIDQDGNLLYENSALTISDTLTAIGDGTVQYGKVFLPAMESTSQGALAIYDLDNDSINIVSVGTDNATNSVLANGQFVFASVTDVNSNTQVQLHNVYRTGQSGVEPVLADAALASFAGIRNFSPDSVFYFMMQDSAHVWDNFAAGMNIYQTVEYLDTPKYEPGNYRVKVTSQDSSVQFYQFSWVNEPLASIESLSSDYDLWTHVDYENNDAWAEMIFVKDPQKLLNFELSPGARIFLNGKWDADYSRINDTASQFFGPYSLNYDSAFVSFEILDYQGNQIDWRLVMTIGGGIQTSSFTGKVYPNPVSNVLHVESNQIVQTVTLLSIDGRPVDEFTVNSRHAVLPAQKLVAGTYILLIKQNGKYKSKIFTRKP